MAAVSGGMWVGAIANDVDNLKEEKSEVKQMREEVKKNTVTLATLSATQKAILKAQDNQDKKLDKILDKLDND